MRVDAREAIYGLLLSGPHVIGWRRPSPGGWNRIHLIVDDLDATIATLRATGAHFRNEVVQGTGGKQILVEDPSGNLVELFQPNTGAYRAPGSGGKP